MTYLNKLEMEFWEKLKLHRMHNKKYLLALSGGLDSIALANLLLKTASKMKHELTVAHIHHGSKLISVEQLNYRNKAWKFCKDWANSNNIPFCSNYDGMEFSSESESCSEEGLRDFRYKELEKLKSEDQILVLAHHADDQLETRLIRLIRGTGPEGLIAMQELNNNIFRPLLSQQRHFLEEYTKNENLQFVQDPSNYEVDPLRNWIRQDWLVQLENKREGAISSLARSLEAISESTKVELDWTKEYVGKSGIDRVGLYLLETKQQRQVLATYLKLNSRYDFRLSQLDELLKRLDKIKNEFTFDMLGCKWVVSREFIQLEPRT